MYLFVYLLVRSFVRSLVCLLLLLSADEDMGMRIEQSRRSSLTQVPLSLIAGIKKMRQRTPSRLFLTESAKLSD